jgi:hypothetical protein
MMNHNANESSSLFSRLKKLTLEIALYILLLIELSAFIIWVSRHVFRA